jgi:hypothetical protein
MLEWTTAGRGGRLGLLVLHDDPRREYAYGPAEGLPDTTVGTFPQALFDEAHKQGWVIISMKQDWNKIFAWEEESQEKSPPRAEGRQRYGPSGTSPTSRSLR